MKKVFVLFLFTGLVFSQANAADVIKPKITDVFVASEDDSRFPSSIPLSLFPPTPVSISEGHSANGIAFRFKLVHDTVINSILAPVAVSNGFKDGKSIPGTWGLNLSLYSGTRNVTYGQSLPVQVIPNVNHRLLNQNFTAKGHDLLPIGHPPSAYTYTYQGVDNLNLEVPAGDYWAAYYGGDGVAYVRPSIEIVSTPEPAVWVFFVFMVGCVFWRVRRNVALGRVV